MDFIERLLGVAPDGGTGSTEALVFIGLTMIVVYLARRRQSAGFTRGSED